MNAKIKNLFFLITLLAFLFSSTFGFASSGAQVIGSKDASILMNDDDDKKCDDDDKKCEDDDDDKGKH